MPDPPTVHTNNFFCEKVIIGLILTVANQGEEMCARGKGKMSVEVFFEPNPFWVSHQKIYLTPIKYIPS